MKRLNDNFLTTLDSIIDLGDKTVLEVGCGNGSKSIGLAALCKTLTAIDPDKNSIEQAKKSNAAPNLSYDIGSAQELKFDSDVFDVVIFSLSLHHVPSEHMHHAIKEATRVLKPDGRVVFLEPGFNGSFFDAEIIFGASDGDERKEKAAAYLALLSSPLLTTELEYYEEIGFKFESVQDFMDSMEPKKNLDTVRRFLNEHGYTLEAQRRINIFSFK